MNTLNPNTNNMFLLLEKISSIIDSIDTMDKKIDTIDKRIDTIDKRLDNIETDVVTLKNYNKTNQDAQEDRVTWEIAEMLTSYHPTYKSKILDWKYLYYDSNAPITDIDGSILLDTTIKIPPSRHNSSENSRLGLPPRNTSVYENLLINNAGKVQSFKSPYLIIIEDKHFLDKKDVDMKLSQIVFVKEILSFVHKRPAFQAPLLSIKALEMIKELELDKLHIDTEVFLVFTFTSTTNNVKEYIKRINEGLDKNTFEILAFKMTLESKSYSKLIRLCMKHNLPKLKNDIVRHSKNYEDLRSSLTSYLTSLDAKYNQIHDEIKYILQHYLPVYNNTIYEKYVKSLGYYSESDKYGFAKFQTISMEV